MPVPGCIVKSRYMLYFDAVLHVVSTNEYVCHID